MYTLILAAVVGSILMVWVSRKYGPEGLDHHGLIPLVLVFGALMLGFIIATAIGSDCPFKWVVVYRAELLPLPANYMGKPFQTTNSYGTTTTHYQYRIKVGKSGSKLLTIDDAGSTIVMIEDQPKTGYIILQKSKCYHRSPRAIAIDPWQTKWIVHVPHGTLKRTCSSG